jgi:hypothetical protein
MSLSILPRCSDATPDTTFVQALDNEKGEGVIGGELGHRKGHYDRAKGRPSKVFAA